MTNADFAEVAGLHFYKNITGSGINGYTRIKDDWDSFYCRVLDWLPRLKIEQALMCLERFYAYDIIAEINTNGSKMYDVTLWDETGMYVISDGKGLDLCNAICTAIGESEK